MSQHVFLSKELVTILTLTTLTAFIVGIVVGHNRYADTVGMHKNSAVIMQSHTHNQHEVEFPYPSLKIMVIDDEKQGWNLYLQTENFRFAPEQVNDSYVSGEGHAHLYINDERITRLYGHWYYIKQLSSGLHTIRVTLSGNDHSELTHQGEIISDEVTIFVP